MSEWIGIAGCSTEKSATINICGGCAEWWNYILVFEDDGDYRVYVEDTHGRHLKHCKLVYHINEEGVKEVDDIDDYESQDDEVIVDRDFFCWDE